MSMNSLGPCAFDLGPSTPVTSSCAAGNFAFSMLMKGIVPPSPMKAAGLSKRLREARSSAAASHGAVDGAFQPVAAESHSKLTQAEYGGALSLTRFSDRPWAPRVVSAGRRAE